MVIHLIKSFS